MLGEVFLGWAVTAALDAAGGVVGAAFSVRDPRRVLDDALKMVRVRLPDDGGDARDLLVTAVGVHLGDPRPRWYEDGVAPPGSFHEGLSLQLEPILDGSFGRGAHESGRRLLDRLGLGLPDLVVIVEEELVAAIRRRAAEIGGLPEQIRQKDMAELMRTVSRIEQSTVEQRLGEVVAPAAEATAVDRMTHADALMRGPLEAIEGLAAAVTAAEQAERADPAAAAAAYREVAAVLEVHGYRGHALLMRQREVAGLASGGDVNAAAGSLIDLGERLVGSGDVDEMTQPMYELRRLVLSGGLAAERTEQARAMLAMYDMLQHPLDDLRPLATAVDILAEVEPGRLPVYVLTLGESAVASGQEAVIRERTEAFNQAAQVANPTSMVGIRIRLSIAEATTEWAEIVTLARRRQLDPPISALALARYARHLTLSGLADEAIDCWWEAINLGALAGLSDTADWLYGVRGCVARYGPITDKFETHHLAQAMRIAGDTTLLPSSRDHHMVALAAIHDHKLPRASQAARRALRDAVIVGHFNREEIVADLLADIYSAGQEPARAAALYVRSGQSKALVQLFETLDDVYIDLRAYLAVRAPWQRATAYTGIAAQADLVPDEDIPTLTAAALDDLAASLVGQIREGPFDPQVGSSALKALAELIERAPAKHAERLIELLSPLVPRDADQGRHTDKAHIRALTGVLEGHPELAPKAAEQLLAMLAMDDLVSDQVVDVAGAAIEDHVDLFLPHLNNLGPGNRAAVLLATRLNQPPADLTPSRRAFERLTAPKVQIPGQVSFGFGLAELALLVRHLPETDRDTAAQTLLSRALDRNEVATNRREALSAIRYLSDVVSTSVREELFNAALEFAHGDQDGSAMDDRLTGTAHPLGTFRISMGPASLVVPGLMLAAALARTPEAAEQVENLATGLLSNRDDRVVRSAALALSWIPDHPAAIPALAFATHNAPNVRALAAIRWARQPIPEDELGLRLANDTAAHVRRVLASAISRRPDLNAPLLRVQEKLSMDPRYSVRKRIQVSETSNGT